MAVRGFSEVVLANVHTLGIIGVLKREKSRFQNWMFCGTRIRKVGSVESRAVYSHIRVFK